MKETEGRKKTQDFFGGNKGGKNEGKVAIVTGSTSGMGEAVAKLLATNGVSVIVNGRNVERGNRVVESIKGTGGNALFVKGDVSLPETNKKLVDTALSEYGRLDFLIMSAGELGIGSVTDIDIDTWKKTLDTNLSAVFYLLHYGIPAMNRESSSKKVKGGSVVVIGSIAAFKVFPNHPAYCASKGALTQLVKQVALDYGPEIRINQICPGQVDTPLLRNSVKAFPDPDKIIEETESKLPLKRLGRVSDIANAVLFLISREAEWITGASFVVDGGSLCIP